MSKVWVTGDAVVDLIPANGEQLLKCPGGAPANVAVGIARLGGEAAFIGRVGQDPFGRFMQQVLEEERVCVQNLIFDEQYRTSTVVVDLDDNGERSFTFMVKPSADQFIEKEDFPQFKTHQWLHVCSIALANEPSRSATIQAMKAIKEAGGYVSFDPNIRHEVWEDEFAIRPVILQVLALADVVKFSDDELLFLTSLDNVEEAIKWMDETYHFPLMVMTQGKSGALMVTNNKQQRISGKVVQPVDTTGAGDAFVGGLLYRLSQNENWQDIEYIKESIVLANACGALATTQKGAMTALPTREKLMEYWA